MRSFAGSSFAQVPKHSVDVHGGLVEEITRVVGFRLVRVDLVLDRSFENVSKNRTDMLVRRRNCARGDGKGDKRSLQASVMSARGSCISVVIPEADMLDI